MITTKNRNLLIIAAIAVTTSIIAGTLVSTYIQQGASAQNQTNSSNAGAGGPLRNLTGSVQVFPRLSQIIQSKANISLSEAATGAEKAVGANSHVISAHLGIVNGFLVYVAHVVDANNNIHRVIIDAGNGKILSATQLPFANALKQPGGKGMFGHYYGHGMYGDSKGSFFGHRGMNNNLGPQM
jgi:uncharacterized membrane protein YkoI